MILHKETDNPQWTNEVKVESLAAVVVWVTTLCTVFNFGRTRP